MEQPCSSLTNFWSSYKIEETFTPSAKKESSEFPSYFDFETFYDSVAYGNEPACYVKPDYPFSWETPTHHSYPNAQPDDDHLDQNNNYNYCDLTSYQDSGGVTQVDLSSQITQEAATLPAGESFLSPVLQQTDEVPLELVEELFMMDETSIPGPIKQEVPEEPPPAPTPVLHYRFQLPLKKRRHVFGRSSTEGKFPCHSCDRSFNRQGHLTQHCNAHHSGPMEQRCAVCGKRFRLREELDKHQARHKEQNKKWECEHCPKKFNYKFDMIRHVKAVHTEAPFTCQFCGKGVVRSDHLVSHENKHRRMMNNVPQKDSAIKQNEDDSNAS